MFDPASTAPIESSQLSQLIVIYGIGYVAVFVVFLLMYLYALRKRHVLRLTRLDLFDARYAIEADVINIGTGLGSIALALLGAPPLVAGFFYFVLARSVRCMAPEAGGIAESSSAVNPGVTASSTFARATPGSETATSGGDERA
jgi:hypothetical protein